MPLRISIGRYHTRKGKVHQVLPGSDHWTSGKLPSKSVLSVYYTIHTCGVCVRACVNACMCVHVCVCVHACVPACVCFVSCVYMCVV